MIKPTLQLQINEAMKARDEVRVSTLKMLSSELHNAAIDNHGDLDEDQELVIVNKEAKKRKDAIEAYEKLGATEKADREKLELEILEEYLPEQLSDETLVTLIDQAIMEINPSGMQDMGRVMGAVMSKVEGKADGTRVSSIVRQKLAS